MNKGKKRLEDFEKSLNNLDVALSWDTETFQDAVMESCIKRFELCYDLAWKCIKDYSKNLGEGRECTSPNSCFKLAFREGVLSEDVDIAGLVVDRNQSVHLYNEDISSELYNKLPDYLVLFRGLYEKISN